MDETIGYLINKFEESNIFNDVNIILMSDHGMAQMKESRVIVLKDYINTANYNSTRSINGVVAHIHPKPGFVKKIKKFFFLTVT